MTKPQTTYIAEVPLQIDQPESSAPINRAPSSAWLAGKFSVAECTYNGDAPRWLLLALVCEHNDEKVIYFIECRVKR